MLGGILQIGADASPMYREVNSTFRRLQRDFSNKPLRVNTTGAQRSLRNLTTQSDRLGASLARSSEILVSFGTAASVIYGIQRGFTALVQSTREVELSFAKIQSILQASEGNFASFQKGIFAAASNTGQAFSEAADVANEFARQGLNLNETLVRTEDALKLVRLAGLQTGDAVASLTAIINTFKAEALGSTEAVDRLSNVAAAFAVSEADLAEAIRRTGATAADSQVSFNELSAAVTALQERTARGGAIIGNGLKSIFTRTQRSETLDLLESLGLEVRTLEGDTKPIIDILKDLANTYDDLSSAQKSQVTQATAGLFQVNNLKALLADLSSESSIYTQALNKANATTTEATQRNAALNETLDALFQRTSNNATKFASDLGSITIEPAVRNVLDGLNTIFEKFEEFNDSSLGKLILGGIGDFLSGPGLVIIGTFLTRLGVAVGKAFLPAIKDLGILTGQSAKYKVTQEQILTVLNSQNESHQRLLASARTEQQYAERILSIYRQITQEAINRQKALQAVAANASFVGVGGRVGSRVPSRAGGFLPVMNALSEEQRAISAGVGGASGSAKPVVIKDFDTGKGKETIVANSDEYIVKNFQGSGASAIFNKEMIKAVGGIEGLKRLGNVSKIGASGIVPNYAAGIGNFRLKDSSGSALPFSKATDEVAKASLAVAENLEAYRNKLIQARERTAALGKSTADHDRQLKLLNVEYAKRLQREMSTLPPTSAEVARANAFQGGVKANASRAELIRTSYETELSRINTPIDEIKRRENQKVLSSINTPIEEIERRQNEVDSKKILSKAEKENNDFLEAELAKLRKEEATIRKKNNDAYKVAFKREQAELKKREKVRAEFDKAALEGDLRKEQKERKASRRRAFVGRTGGVAVLGAIGAQIAVSDSDNKNLKEGVNALATGATIFGLFPNLFGGIAGALVAAGGGVKNLIDGVTSLGESSFAITKEYEEQKREASENTNAIRQYRRAIQQLNDSVNSGAKGEAVRKLQDNVDQALLAIPNASLRNEAQRVSRDEKATDSIASLALREENKSTLLSGQGQFSAALSLVDEQRSFIDSIDRIFGGTRSLDNAALNSGNLESLVNPLVRSLLAELNLRDSAGESISDIESVLSNPTGSLSEILKSIGFDKASETLKTFEGSLGDSEKFLKDRLLLEFELLLSARKRNEEDRKTTDQLVLAKNTLRDFSKSARIASDLSQKAAERDFNSRVDRINFERNSGRSPVADAISDFNIDSAKILNNAFGEVSKAIRDAGFDSIDQILEGNTSFEQNKTIAERIKSLLLSSESQDINLETVIESLKQQEKIGGGESQKLLAVLQDTSDATKQSIEDQTAKLSAQLDKIRFGDLVNVFDGLFGKPEAGALSGSANLSLAKLSREEFLQSRGSGSRQKRAEEFNRLNSDVAQASINAFEQEVVSGLQKAGFNEKINKILTDESLSIDAQREALEKLTPQNIARDRQGLLNEFLRTEFSSNFEKIVGALPTGRGGRRIENIRESLAGGRSVFANPNGDLGQLIRSLIRNRSSQGVAKELDSLAGRFKGFFDIINQDADESGVSDVAEAQVEEVVGLKDAILSLDAKKLNSERNSLLEKIEGNTSALSSEITTSIVTSLEISASANTESIVQTFERGVGEIVKAIEARGIEEPSPKKDETDELKKVIENRQKVIEAAQGKREVAQATVSAVNAKPAFDPLSFALQGATTLLNLDKVKNLSTETQEEEIKKAKATIQRIEGAQGSSGPRGQQGLSGSLNEPFNDPSPSPFAPEVLSERNRQIKELILLKREERDLTREIGDISREYYAKLKIASDSEVNALGAKATQKENERRDLYARIDFLESNIENNPYKTTPLTDTSVQQRANKLRDQAKRELEIEKRIETGFTSNNNLSTSNIPKYDPALNPSFKTSIPVGVVEMKESFKRLQAAAEKQRAIRQGQVEESEKLRKAQESKVTIDGGSPIDVNIGVNATQDPSAAPVAAEAQKIVQEEVAVMKKNIEEKMQRNLDQFARINQLRSSTALPYNPTNVTPTYSSR